MANTAVLSPYFLDHLSPIITHHPLHACLSLASKLVSFSQPEINNSVWIENTKWANLMEFRSQGTLSDLLRNPKPWSKLKSGRETFRRMAKWLQEPEFQRMSALRLAGIFSIFLFGILFKSQLRKKCISTNNK